MGWHRQLALCYCCFFFTFLKALHGYDMYKLYNFVYDMPSEVKTNYCKDGCLYSEQTPYDTYSCLVDPSNYEFVIDEDFSEPVDLNDSYVHISGSFNCATAYNDTQQETVQILINGNPITDPVPVPNSLGGSCWCSNCLTEHVLQISAESLEAQLNHSANATNTISLSLGSHNSSFACLGAITLELHFNVPEFRGKSITPVGGPTSGHTNVTVFLDGIPPDDAIYCVFDGHKTLSRRLGPDTLTCRSPYSFPGIIEFTVAIVVLGDYYYVPSFAYFQFYYETILTKVVPYYGPTKGGTLVSVHGNFEYTDTCSCLFSGDGITKETTCVSTSNYKEVLCKTPPWSKEARVDLSVSLNGQQHSTKLKFYYSDKGILSDNDLLTIIIVGSVIFILILVVSVIIIIQIYRKSDKHPVQHLDKNSHICVDDLVFKECIGRGRFSEVYRTVWHGTTVAAKKLLAGRINNHFTSEFEKEVYLMSNLRAPNVLQFLGAIYEPPNVIIVTEYMPRGSMYQVLHDPDIDLGWDVVLGMLADTARGMNYLHECRPPVIHRDLKSHNLLIDEYWRVKVCDFGLSTVLSNAKGTGSLKKKWRKFKKKNMAAKSKNSNPQNGKKRDKGVKNADNDSNSYDSDNSDNSEDSDKDGALCVDGGGTPYWTAPEVIRGLPASTKSDVYSFGIVMWECATRKVPYDGMPPFKVIYAMGTEGIRPQVPPDMPFAYLKLMKRCWDDDANLRPEFSAILESLGQMCPYSWKRIPLPEAVEIHGNQHKVGGFGGEKASVTEVPPPEPSSQQMSSSVPTPPKRPSLRGFAQRQERMAYLAKVNEKSPLLLMMHRNGGGGGNGVVGEMNEGLYYNNSESESDYSGSTSGGDGDVEDDYEDYIYVNDDSGFNINGDGGYI